MLWQHTIWENGINEQTEHIAHKHHFNHFPEAVAVVAYKIKKHRGDIYKPHKIGDDEIFTKGNKVINRGMDYEFWRYCFLQKGKNEKID